MNSGLRYAKIELTIRYIHKSVAFYLSLLENCWNLAALDLSVDWGSTLSEFS